MEDYTITVLNAIRNDVADIRCKGEHAKHIQGKIIGIIDKYVLELIERQNRMKIAIEKI